MVAYTFNNSAEQAGICEFSLHHTYPLPGGLNRKTLSQNTKQNKSGG